MALEDIEKLREKVERDPNSKLFVPLAEEYRKKGMLDEAIDVLLKGLNNQPGYMSARVSLGKMYIEKQMLPEAREEFEKVIAAIPDNLFAQKKLAEIHRGLGNREKAIGAYKTVLRLNPLDDDSVTNLETLQTTPIVEEVAAPVPPVKEILAKKEDSLEVADAEEAEAVEVLEEELLPSEQSPKAVHGAEFENFMKEMAGRDAEDKILDADAATLDEAVAEVVEEFDAEEGIPLKNAGKEAAAYADMFKEAKTAESRKGEDIEDIKADFKEAIKEDFSFELPAEVKEAAAEKPKVKEPMSLPESFKNAEAMIAKGDYSNAMKIYRELLSSDSRNKDILQKIEELRMLLKLLGKEREIVIDKLESFSERLKKGQDEFLKSS